MNYPLVLATFLSVFYMQKSLAQVSQKDKQPNIVFILTDDQQYDALGCMGNEYIKTPNIDKLASQGVLFERFYATTSICMASRASIMTGMYEFKTGCNFQTGALQKVDWQNLSYPVQLKKAGYITAFGGKWGFGISNNYDKSQDFDAWGALDGSQGHYTTSENPNMKAYAKKYPHVTRALGAFGSDFIKSSATQEKPFCLSISFKAPHTPHNNIDPIDQKLYQDVELPYPALYGEEGASLMPPQPKMGRQYVQRYRWQPDVFQKNLKDYYRLISGVDSAVGMIMETLETQGLADNTVVIFTSDNGYFCGARNLDGKVLPYDKGSKVPMIVFDPRVSKESKGKRTKAISGNIDVAPTILDMAGIAIPEKMDGKSLMPIIDNPKAKIRDYIGLIQAWDVADRDLPKGLAIATEDYKYINWCYADENIPETEELFNLNDDPDEAIDMVEINAEELKQMQAYYDEFLAYWATNSVNSEKYTRYEKIFSRHIPWQEKEFIVFPEKAPKRWKKHGANFMENYKVITGEDYPEIPNVNTQKKILGKKLKRTIPNNINKANKRID